jgi:hypothetical protein
METIPMSVVHALPITKSRLLTLMGELSLPIPLRMGLFGVTYQERGKYSTTAAEELCYPAQAILARVLVEHPHLALRMTFPTTREFYDAVHPIEPQKRRQSLRLGMECTLVSRELRTSDTPNPAAWSLMALACSPINGGPGKVWRMIEGAAMAEASARGIADLDAVGRGGR